MKASIERIFLTFVQLHTAKHTNAQPNTGEHVWLISLKIGNIMTRYFDTNRMCLIIYLCTLKNSFEEYLADAL